MTTAPVWGGRGRCKSEDEHKRKLIFDNRASASVASSPTVVATISKSRSSQLRVLPRNGAISAALKSARPRPPSPEIFFRLALASCSTSSNCQP